MTSSEIRQAIDVFDTTRLDGEYAELLIKFIPTKDEVWSNIKYNKIYVDLWI